MLTFSKLSKKGNLGNQLFHIASTIGLASKHQQTYSFPEWEYTKYFDFEIPITPEAIKFKYRKEKNYHYYDWDLLKDKNYDIEGWLQSEKYFDIPLTRQIFRFKEDFIQNLRTNYNFLFNKKNILITVRRGDFIHHPFYYQLSYKFYFLALIESFPDWQERNLVFTSDDIDYCKYHFDFLPNSFFLEKLSAIEQLALGSQMDDYIISNSTFSWWVAWLGENSQTKIIRPLKKFRGIKSTLSDEQDFFPERWTVFTHRGRRVPTQYFKLIFKGNLFLLNKFVYNKLRGIKYRIIKHPKYLNRPT